MAPYQNCEKIVSVGRKPFFNLLRCFFDELNYKDLVAIVKERSNLFKTLFLGLLLNTGLELCQ